MGASLVYLDKPNKEIHFQEGENDFIKYVAGDMQGWRINMVSILFKIMEAYLHIYMKISEMFFTKGRRYL